MVSKKYFDWKRNEFLYPPIDGCKFENWSNDSEKFSYCIHDKGFLIFLSPQEMPLFDEYKNGDPYGIEDNTRSPFHKGRVNTTIELINPFISDCKTNIHVLDVGCGQGHITSKIKEKFPTINISGLDISLTAIEYAHQRHKGIDFIVGDVYSPPYSEAFFDIIICNNTWEHITDPVRMLNTLHKILKKRGVIIMSTPSRYRTSNLLKSLLGRSVSINEHHVTEYSVGQVIEQFKFSGFSVSKIKGLEVKGQGGSLFTRFIIHRIIKRMFKVILNLLKSHHILESTVFYLAQKL
jgi:ubiquinone/menaquinone biosynthesis C-methylase UbiE